MSLPQLMSGGAECGPSNPMSGLTKQFSQDRSLQQDVFVRNHGEGTSRSAFRAHVTETAPDAQLADEFFREPVATATQFGPSDAFRFEQFHRELDAIKSTDWTADFLKQADGPQLAAQDLHAFDAAFNKARNQGRWADEFRASHAIEGSVHPEEAARFEQAFDEAKKSALWESEFAGQATAWANEFSKQMGQETNTGDDKDELARAAADLVKAVDNEADPKFKDSTFLGFMRKLRDREVTIEGNKVVEQKAPASSATADWTTEFLGKPNDTWSTEFAAHTQDSSWASEFSTSHAANSSAAQASANWAAQFASADQSLRTSEKATQETLPKWAQEFQDVEGDGPKITKWLDDFRKYIDKMAERRIDGDWGELQADWERYEPTANGFTSNAEFYDEYKFAPDNPFLASPMQQNSTPRDLSESILALEAAVQFDPQNSSSWHQLGIRQQENEQEPQSIAALRRTVELDPTLLDAWLGLAVSYTNENSPESVFDALEAWLANNDKYAHLLRDARAAGPTIDRYHLIPEVFLKAAVANPGENLDPDVQIGLGVLFNVTEEFQKAVDCFQAALQVRPNDYMLWNKLGATLANSGQPEKAISAYYNALAINPSYVRARFNLAVAFLKLEQTQNAAESLLAALALQAGVDHAGEKVANAVGGGMSSNIWELLKFCMRELERFDLLSRCDMRDLNAFRGEFDF